jgi:hypothetical protein
VRNPAERAYLERRLAALDAPRPKGTSPEPDAAPVETAATERE